MTKPTMLYKIDFNLRKRSLLQIIVEEYSQGAMVKGEGAFFRGSSITANTRGTYVWRDGAMTPHASDWHFVLILGEEKLVACLLELFMESNPDFDEEQAKQYVDDVIEELNSSRILNKSSLN